MKHVLFATVAVLGLATAIPAFADSGDNPDRVDSANSLPSSLMWTAPGVARLVSLVAVISCASTGCPVAPLVVFFCLVKSRRFRPEIAQASRAAVVKHGRRPPRSVLDPGEHGANVGQAGGIVMPPDQRWRKIRSVAPLCPACNAAFAAGHHGCARTCQAPICLA